jgi:hypothetical protein
MFPLAENLKSTKELMMGPISMNTTTMVMVNPYANEL